MEGMNNQKIENQIADFDSYVTKVGNHNLTQKWVTLKSRLEDMVLSKKAPAHVKRLGDAGGPGGDIIVICSSEISHLPKEQDPGGVISTGDGGGLGPYTAALFRGALELGRNAHLVIPYWKDIFRNESKHLSTTEFGEAINEVMRNPRIHLVRHSSLRHATTVYGDMNYAIPDMDFNRAIAFSAGILDRVRYHLNRDYPTLNKLYHLNEWSLGLVPGALKYYNRVFDKCKIRSLMTFHNVFTHYPRLFDVNDKGLITQEFWREFYYTNAFPSGDHNHDMHNLYVDLLTSGIMAADYINTVSPKFLEELVNYYFEDLGIITPNMRNMIIKRYRQGQARGILNGTDFDPENSHWLGEGFQFGTRNIIEGKEKNKLRFQDWCSNLDVNHNMKLALWPHRYTEHQKNARMFTELIPYLLDYHKDLQIAIVANGEQSLIDQAKSYMSNFPGRLSYMPFDRRWSEIGKVGANLNIMPSVYEPCGLPQIEGLRSGMLTVGRYTGGIAFLKHLDSRINYSEGNGFVFNDCSKSALWWGIEEGMRFCRQPDSVREPVLQRIREKSLVENSSTRMVGEYIPLWEHILAA